MKVNVEEAKRRLEIAIHRLNGCEAHLNKSHADLNDAWASRGDNRRYYRLQRTHGHGYTEKFEKAAGAALEEFHKAQEEVEKAENGLERAEAACKGNG